MSKFLAIRWTWYTSEEEYEGCNYIPPKEWLEYERDSPSESSCEVEYADGLWWCSPESFGLVLDPHHPIRRVWSIDVHTFTNHKGRLIAGDCPSSARTAVGWEGVHKKFPKWRKHKMDKIWWAEGTFPPKPPVVAFAMMNEPAPEALKMWEIAREVFGNLPVIRVEAHPAALDPNFYD